MGAFFLAKEEVLGNLDVPAVQNVFQQKGFNNPEVFTVGPWKLFLYRKQLVDTPNFLVDGNNAIFVLGTIAYKEKSYKETIELLLEDFLSETLDFGQMYGNFCLIFKYGDKIEIVNDSLNVYEIFTDRENSFFTSSFLAAAESQRELTIDRLASKEKLLTGYIVGEPTLFQEIRRVIPSHFSETDGFKFYKWEPVRVNKADHKRSVSVSNRVKSIKTYFGAIRELAVEFKPELGLSGGYDSRLLFAVSQGVWPVKLEVHTHSTEGVQIHDVEKKIVTQMAETKDTPIKIIPTHNMDYYSDSEIEEILKDGYFFFDGRCAYNMGAFSSTYTRAYKLQTVGEHRLTLNGLGGEMYRNYYINLKPLVNTKQWMKANVYPDSIDFVLDKELFNELHGYICGKMQQELSFSWGKWLTKFKIRRYYSEMRMPDCDALNCNAHNQLEFYLTPFIERVLVEDAYKGRVYTSRSGEYQADIIKEADSEIASFLSHYGFPLDKREPAKRKIYMLLRGIMPDFLWNIRIHNMVEAHGSKVSRNKDYFDRVQEKCAFLSESSLYLERLFPELNFDYLRLDYAMMPNSTYVGVVYYMLKNKINIKGTEHE